LKSEPAINFVRNTFKSTMKYDGDLGGHLHNFPTAEDLPA
jgi:hypothetical protein